MKKTRKQNRKIRKTKRSRGGKDIPQPLQKSKSNSNDTSTTVVPPARDLPRRNLSPRNILPVSPRSTNNGAINAFSNF